MECGTSISSDGYGQDRVRIMAILAQDANTDRKDPPDTTLLTERQLPLGGPCKDRVREASRVSTTSDLRDEANFTRRGSIITGESMKENPVLSKKLVDTRIV